MRIGLRRVGTALLFVVVAILLAPIVAPPFLDRVYYRGPVSDHFDGARFFNPDGDMNPRQKGSRSAAGFMWRAITGRDRVAWPKHVAVAPGYPPAQATTCPPVVPGRAIENWARCVPHPDPSRMFATWIGHSTVLVQAAGLNILTDPVWSAKAGPFGLLGPRRVRDPGIRFEDLPPIDLVLVSHNHYDHMDLATLKRLWARDRPLIVTSLGNDTILRAHGIPAQARDWGGRMLVRAAAGQSPIEVVVERVHHWGSRWGSDRNRALWSGFSVTLPGGNLFFAGDTGFGDGSWAVAAARDGPYRLAIIPIGAFQPRAMMSPSHIDPIESVEVFRRLGAANALAVHWGTFRLSEEGIDDPPALLAKELARQGIAAGRFRATEVGRPWEIPPIEGGSDGR